MEKIKSNNEYLKEPEIVDIAKKVSLLYENDNVKESVSLAIQIFRQIQTNPKLLRDVQDFEDLGKAFFIMLNHKVSNDTDTLELIANIGYFCLSKAIEKDNQNNNLYKDRYFLLEIGRDYFKYSLISALVLDTDPLFSGSDYGTRVEIYRMQIADVELHPILYRKLDSIQKDRNEYIKAIEKGIFSPDKTLDDSIKSGVNNHKLLNKYLEKKIIKDLDLDFQ